MAKRALSLVALVLVSCMSSTGVPLIERSRVEIPTAVAGLLETDGHCYRLTTTSGMRTILWVRGTRFGREVAGHYVIDVDGNKRYAGQRIGLSGGPLATQNLPQDPRMSQYVRNCGQVLIIGLRFTAL